MLAAVLVSTTSQVLVTVGLPFTILVKSLSTLLTIVRVVVTPVKPSNAAADEGRCKVRNVLSNDFEKYDTPSILDFGGGHVYNEGLNELLKNYPNIFLLMPSTDTEKSNELLRKANEERWTEFMDQTFVGAFLVMALCIQLSLLE